MFLLRVRADLLEECIARPESPDQSDPFYGGHFAAAERPLYGKIMQRPIGKNPTGWLAALCRHIFADREESSIEIRVFLTGRHTDAEGTRPKADGAGTTPGARVFAEIGQQGGAQAAGARGVGAHGGQPALHQCP